MRLRNKVFVGGEPPRFEQYMIRHHDFPYVMQAGKLVNELDLFIGYAMAGGQRPGDTARIRRNTLHVIGSFRILVTAKLPHEHHGAPEYSGR